MNPAKYEKIFSLMRQFGVEYFKNSELEIKLSVATVGEGKVKARASKTTSSPTVAPEPQAIPPVDMPIPHHVNEVANLMKLNDMDLVDKLFPDYTQLPPKDGE